jgi:hypothetical protein
MPAHAAASGEDDPSVTGEDGCAAGRTEADDAGGGNATSRAVSGRDGAVRPHRARGSRYRARSSGGTMAP